jgi:hypothetical protein
VWVLAIAQLGCRTLLGFEDPHDRPNDAASDTTRDAATACRVGTDVLAVDRGHVGGSGGAPMAAIVCAAGQLPVGVTLRMSDQNTSSGYRSAHGIVITCAAVDIDPTGAHLSPPTTIMTQGSGGAGWTPSTFTPTTSCQEGWILSGFTVHTAIDGARFANVSIQCTQVSPSGSQIGLEVIPVAGSLDELAGATSASCLANEVITQVPSRAGAGLDGLDLLCSPLRCEP